MYETILHCPRCGLEHMLVAEDVVNDRNELREALRTVYRQLSNLHPPYLDKIGNNQRWALQALETARLAVRQFDQTEPDRAQSINESSLGDES